MALQTTTWFPSPEHATQFDASEKAWEAEERKKIDSHPHPQQLGLSDHDAISKASTGQEASNVLCPSTCRSLLHRALQQPTFDGWVVPS